MEAQVAIVQRSMVSYGLTVFAGRAIRPPRPRLFNDPARAVLFQGANARAVPASVFGPVNEEEMKSEGHTALANVTDVNADIPKAD